MKEIKEAEKMKNENGKMWFDDRGEPIQAHGGCILKYRNTWYWYGENKGVENVPGMSRVDVIGISCYSSPDLKIWHYEGLALPVGGEKNSLLRPECVCERPKVLYNEKTGRFVMWMHLDDAAYCYAGVGVAVSDTPTGPFKLIREFHPNRQDSRDMTLFGEDGRAWLIHSSNWNKTLHIAELTEDYTDVNGVYVSALAEQEREAPALVRHGDLYYMVTSGCTGWEPNSALYAVSGHMMGQWKLVDNPCEGEGYRKTFGGQSTFIFQAEGHDYLMLDHWRPDDLKNSGYSILPILFENGNMTIKWVDCFTDYYGETVR